MLILVVARAMPMVRIKSWTHGVIAGASRTPRTTDVSMPGKAASRAGTGWIAARAVVSIVADDASRRFRRRGAVFDRLRRHAGAVRPWCQT